MSFDRAKEAVGRAAARLVLDGMRVGLGTGSTARWFIVALGEAVAGGLRVTAVASSEASARLASDSGIQLVELDRSGLDLAVDGADQVDPRLRLVKGGGGAQVREKVVAAAARRFVVIADESKLVPQLQGPVPVEIIGFGREATLAALEECGAPFSLRLDADGRPRTSDSGNLLADGHFGVIADPEGLAQRLDAVPGLVGHGLFLGMAERVLVGDQAGGVRELARSGGRV
ncbi:MAG TPA: ribose-5-phosphate isomerase RpiA [Candidatus Binatia bacterium]|nr:ribose-5-phosphate isomerase RpiA [Candidatus Binatia bacterium]